MSNYEKSRINSYIDNTLETLESCKQLNAVKIAIDNIAHMKQIINRKDIVIAYSGNCYVEPEKKPIDLFSDAELLEEIQKRLNSRWTPCC